MKDKKRRDGYKWDDEKQEKQLRGERPEPKPEQEPPKSEKPKKKFKKGGMVRGCGKATKGARKARMY